MVQKAWTKVAFLAFLLQNITPSFAAANSRAIVPPNGCATRCKESGSNPAGWSTFPVAADYFQRCSYAPALFAYNIESQAPPTAIRACEDLEDAESAGKESKDPPVELERRLCAPMLEFDVEVSRTPAKDPGQVIAPGQVMGAAMTIQDSLLQNFLDSGMQLGDGLVMHAHWADAVVGVYVGSGLDRTQFANGPLEDFIQGIQQFGVGKNLQTQFCGGNSSNSASVFGIIADTSGIQALPTIRNAVRLWSKGQCVEMLEQVSPRARNTLPTRHVLSDSSNGTDRAGIWTRPNQQVPRNWTGTLDEQNSNIDGITNSAQPRLNLNNRLAAYAQNECIVTEVQSGDSCGKLAEICQLDPNKFMQINNKPNLCATLMPGQRVCCSEGELPDIRPKQQPNGDCAVHTVAKGEWCAIIASKNGITVQELESLNKKTWGWNGCEKLFPGTKLCVSAGEPPFPLANSDATCGPTKPGTKKPPGSQSTEWGKLNECPLKACCNIWGNCGTTSDFCVDKSAGPPGSSKGLNGCVGNCGLTIMNNKRTPAEFRHIGYFEAWNHDRPCLHMDVEDIPAGKYTHVHFAFPEITNDYRVNMGKLQDQFDKFRNAKGYKRIVAFGGWAFSTEAPTAHIFRNGVRPGNRERLATSLADFVIQNDLDGIDFDWEYPGVPDMDWLPPSSPDEGPNYLEFLKLVRSKLPQKSMSIAAPASFWYLKAFPIEEISKIVDYIVYMTYDLHGQWDYGNKWSQPGCPGGNCLRSHVDLSETYSALVMITKVGVPSDKITVGVTSYGRQFKMTDPSCTHENCTYTAKPEGTRGRCTNEPSYISNAEIKEIIKTNPSVKVVDIDGSSKYMTYDGNWVAYMDDNDKQARTNLWKSLNFGGVIDWAIDLNTFDYDNRSGSGDSKGTNGLGGLQVAKGMRGGGVYDKSNFGSTCGDDESWRKVDCTVPGIDQHSRMEDSKKWANVKADAAWCAGIKNWTSLRDSGNTRTSFSDYIMGDIYKGSSPFHCENLQNPALKSCVPPKNCLGPDTKSAASMQLIGLSMANVHMEFRALYDGLNEASIHKVKALDVISSILVPKPDKSLEIFMNILSIALSFASTSFLNGFAKPFVTALGGKGTTELTDAEKAAKAEAYKVKADNIKDYTNLVVNNGMNAAKDKTKSLTLENEKDIKKKIEYLFEDTVRHWQESLVIMNKVVFAGDERGIEVLTKLIHNGNSINRTLASSLEVQDQTTKFLVSIMVPEVWRMQGYYPVLVDTAFPCGVQGIGIGQWTKQKNVGEAEICLTNEGGIGRDNKPFFGGRQYQLWGVKGRWDDHCKQRNNPCRIEECTHYMEQLPGLKKIREPIEEWRGLAIFDMINNAKNGIDNIWHGNHKYTLDDAMNPTMIEQVVSGLDNSMDIFALPGTVTIPSCSWADIKSNWEKGITDDNRGTYPCTGN